MSLKHIIGQGKAIAMLSGMMQRQRIASSYLFCGEPGIGKKSAAINFAKALNCRGTDGPGYRSPDACDSCDSCSKIDTGSHPDVLLIVPEERQIRIDEIRLVDEALSFKPFEAEMKVVIVDEAEAMNISAANAFLKTLEEPPPDSIIILVTSRPDLLPLTIRSRCSRIDFSPLSPEACRQVLEKRALTGSLDLVSRLAMGRPGTALSGDLIEEREGFLNLFKGMLRAEKDGWASREDMEKWFEQVTGLLRDITVLKVTGNDNALINNDLAAYLHGISKSVDAKGIIEIHGTLCRVKKLLLFNLNKSITWNYTASLLRKGMQVQDA